MSFWKMIHSETQTITGLLVPFKPRLFLLNYLDATWLQKVGIPVKNLIGYLTVSARMALAKRNFLKYQQKRNGLKKEICIINE